MGRVSRRVGVLGGTFDPIHDGHLVAAQEAWHQLTLDYVLLLPAGDPPHKSGHRFASARHRVCMVELAIAGRDHLSVSHVDLDRPGPHYTADALALLQEELGPEVRLYFIEGADSLAEVSTWHQPERVLAAANLAVVGRPGYSVNLDALEARLPGLSQRIHWVSMPALAISSTDLRLRVRTGRPISYLLPACVEAYIYEHRLYQDP
ncbi:MAG: nicotinate-nucleotide adenylyltransferase [Anaerolineae bacterium]|nr:nicotinate-nucleotide adenylyltransferase [Anaerolineae bacterium]